MTAAEGAVRPSDRHSSGGTAGGALPVRVNSAPP